MNKKQNTPINRNAKLQGLRNVQDYLFKIVFSSDCSMVMPLYISNKNNVFKGQGATAEE